MLLDHIKPSQFDVKITKHSGMLLVAFHAEWCPFCRKFISLFREYKNQSPITFKESLVNEDDNPFWVRFNIEAIPTLIAFKDGKEINRRDALPGIGLRIEDIDSIIQELHKI